MCPQILRAQAEQALASVSNVAFAKLTDPRLIATYVSAVGVISIIVQPLYEGCGDRTILVA